MARNLPILIAPPLSVYQPTPTSKPVKKHTKGGGGAGTKEKTEETRGHLPALALSQLAPPMIVREEKPQLTVTPTIVAPPELRLQSVALPDLGNPLSGRVSVVLSNGPGGHSGIGSGSNNGVGPGEGTGVGPGRDGGYGDNRYSAGDLEVTAPVPKYAPEPEFSEEARRLKYQGVVTLAAVIGTDGRPHNLRVVRSLGMGLDEKALEKAKTWLFEPGKRNGRPVAVNMYLEVNFRLF
ncbi:MAG TPA: energy transducer TonB [Alphaproteobacteria bacterium]|nr:energy transducer TonB [Alphaproteobacteria bacterium]